ncbi:hypothetical protein [Ancylothrix sp. D3o]|uniref:hypothetical protein n=1 Tax=Ancylothrix sp. D3o TaxID=2953691 RepID=UPI0021BA50D1|nr:hypothetical protein [Ancylothrix sp. D3o]
MDEGDTGTSISTGTREYSPTRASSTGPSTSSGSGRLTDASTSPSAHRLTDFITSRGRWNSLNTKLDHKLNYRIKRSDNAQWQANLHLRKSYQHRACISALL